MTKQILLSFDIEEFDLPREFDLHIDEMEMYEVSKKGLLKITVLATIFIMIP